MMILQYLLAYAVGSLILPSGGEGKCLSFAADGTCCSNSYNMDGGTFSSCYRADLSIDGKTFRTRQCMVGAARVRCMDNTLPAIGLSHPLGMMNGGILKEQLIVPSGNSTTDNARLYTSSAWKAEDAYITLHTGTHTCFTGLTSVPMSVLLNAPIFFEVTFFRPKWLYYLVIQDGNAVSGEDKTSRKFALAYRNLEGKSVSYSTDGLSAQILTCSGMFGRLNQDCRQEITKPFRAKAVRVVSVDYSLTYKDSWSLEFGGMDYMEADNHWWLDSIMVGGLNDYFQDVRGKYRLDTTKSAPERANYTGPDAGILKNSETATATASSNTECIVNPQYCDGGLSVTFSLKGGPGQIGVMTTGQTDSDKCTGSGLASLATTNIGFKICWVSTSTMYAIVVTTNKQYIAYYSHPSVIEKFVWNHYAITWSAVSGVSIFKDGALLLANNSTTTGSFSQDTLRKIRLGTDTDKYKDEQVHDLRFWSFKLSPGEILDLHSSGKGTKSTREAEAKKFRPKSCSEAMAAYGTKRVWYTVYTSTGPMPVKCEQGSMAITYLNHDALVRRVVGPWASGSFQAVFNYHTISAKITEIIQRADSCRQVIHYNCKNAKITGVAKVYDKDHKEIVMPCSCANTSSCTATAGSPAPNSCNCDALGAAENNDTQVFENKALMPISKVTVNGLTSASDYLQFLVGPVECFEGAKYDSCREALEANGQVAGLYTIRLLNAYQLRVLCENTSSGTKSAVRHRDSNTELYINGYEDPGSYYRKIAYDQDLNSMIALINSSKNCRQYIGFKCHNVHWESSWFTNRNKEKLEYRPGGPVEGEGCACGTNNTCRYSGFKCNCAKNHFIWLHDDGAYERKEDLPLTAFYGGDTGGSGEIIKLRIGDLECFSGATYYESCNAALIANGLAAGEYLLRIGGIIVKIPCQLIGIEVKTTMRHEDSGKAIYINGYEDRASYSKVIAYKQSLPVMLKLVDASERCQQSMDIVCAHSMVYKQNWGWLMNGKNEKMSYLAGGNGTGCACGVSKTCADTNNECNCDSNDNVVRYDNGTVTRKSDLPLTAFYTGDTGNPNEYKIIVIGDLECFTIVKYYESCNAALVDNNLEAGEYPLKIGGAPIKAKCQLIGGQVQTTLGHQDGGKAIYIHGYEEIGSYSKVIAYKQSLPVMLKVIEASGKCQQSMDIACHSSKMVKNQQSWLLNGKSEKMSYLAGGSGTGCACGVTNTCADTNNKCNCDSNDNVLRYDNGTVTTKSDLPLTAFYTSDTGSSYEYKIIVIGDLECFATYNAAPASSSCTQKTIDGSCCKFPFTHNSQTYNKCIDDNDSYGPWCLIGYGTKGYCRTEEASLLTNEMDDTGNCKFPFNFQGKTYQNCISLYSSAPWCSLTSNYTGSWRYCMSTQPKADIDFTIMTNENHGDWTISNDCSGEKNSGPCYDMSASSKPNERGVNKVQRYEVPMINYAVYDFSTKTCSDRNFQAGTNKLAAMSFDLGDPSRPKVLIDAIFEVAAYLSPAGAVIANIYAVLPLSKYQTNFLSNCKFITFRNNMYYGPIEWKTGPWATSSKVSTPDLKELITPILRSDDATINKRLYLLFEWKEFIIRSSLTGIPGKNLIFRYHDKTSNNYLLADPSSAKSPNLPLIYITRYFSPSKKCLQFWYYMQGVGGRYLSVNVNQKDSVATEITRIVGDQGGKWKKATIPIESFLKTDGYLFNVAFVAGGDTDASRGIAIDDISFLSESCKMQPIDKRNLALGKPTQQSTTFSSISESSNAVDGFKITIYNGHCAHTKVEKNAWWQVDLGRKEIVTSVRVTNRGDCCGERLSKFDVRVGDVTSSWASAAKCIDHQEQVPNGRTIDLPCSNPVTGQFVFFVLQDLNAHNILTLCEVEVYSNTADNLPRPEILIPLDHSHYDQGLMGQAVSKITDQPSMKITLDKFGYPLFAAFFNMTALATFEYSSEMKISSGFTFCFHLKTKWMGDYTLFAMKKDGAVQMSVSAFASGEMSLSFNVGGFGLVEAKSKPFMNITQWKYICFVYEEHLGSMKILADSVVQSEVKIGYVKPAVSFNSLEIGAKDSAGLSKEFGVHVSCLQLYNKTLDLSVIQVLDVCPNRHVKDACNSTCSGDAVCDQLSGKCICPTYASRFVKDDCSNALAQLLYNDATDAAYFDSRKHLPAKIFSTFTHVNDSQINGTTFEDYPYIYATSPVNTGICFLKTGAVNLALSSQSCFALSECLNGGTMSVWIRVPPVSDWNSTGNLTTLITAGYIKIMYGLANDVRNGTKRPIASLMFGVSGSAEMCLWTTMIYNTMITSVWSHVAVTVDSTNDITSVYYNGRRNHAVKGACAAPTQKTPNFISGDLALTCMDEFALWNRVLPSNETQRIYNATVFGGQQPIRHQIAFKKLTLREPDELWALDQSGAVHKYFNASWIYLPFGRIREIHAGVSGVFFISQNNSLYKINGISKQNPTGTSFELIKMSADFQGAIMELGTGYHGEIIAKSLYKWHCVDTQTSSSTKTVQKFFDSQTAAIVVKTDRCQCNVNQCFFVGFDQYQGNVYGTSKNATVCSYFVTSPSIEEASNKVKLLAFGAYQLYPFAVRADNSKLMERLVSKDGSINNWYTHDIGAFSDVAAVNGIPVGITASGKVIMVGEAERFLIRLVDGKCLTRHGRNFQPDYSCNALFALKDGCLLVIETMKYVGFKTQRAEQESSCEEKYKIELHRDAKLRFTKSDRKNKCIVIENNLLHYKDRDCKSTDVRMFYFEQVNPFKNIPDHSLKQNHLPVGNADVILNMNVVAWILFPKTAAHFKNPQGPETNFYCTKIINEVKQVFAGNVNLRGVDCGSLQLQDCPSDDQYYCNYKSNLVLKFRHFGADERLLYYSKKFAGEWTDCQNIRCKFETSTSSVGVDLTPVAAYVKETTSKTVRIDTQPSSRITYAAQAGYNVSFAGYSKFGSNLISVYRRIMYRAGDSIIAKSLRPYFTYETTIAPLFVRGEGNPVKVTFDTKEDTPTAAPNMTVMHKTRTEIHFTVIPIPNTAWHGEPKGYRVYYQSMLVLKSPVDSTSLTQVNSTHKFQDILFANAQAQQMISGLEVFTNYSLLIGAYNNYAIGPMTQIFARTQQGEPEVVPSDFNVAVVDSYRLNLTWSSFTTDIEILNGWLLSGYYLSYEEYATPTVSTTATTAITARKNMTSFLIENLPPGREYKVSLAAQVEGRSGPAKEWCIRTNEAAPSLSVRHVSVLNITESTIGLTTGCVKVKEERGIILYYIIQATDVRTNENMTYRANITEEACVKNDSPCGSEAKKCKFEKTKQYIDNRQYYSSAHNCSSVQEHQHSTSYVISYTLRNLKFWTEYCIRIKPCNLAGCGPFNAPTTVRTGEHIPTCAPNITCFQNMSSTSLGLTWLKLPLNCAHGVVFSYNVYFSPKSELTGKECFNSSSCWELYNSTLSQTKFYSATSNLTMAFRDLRKYKEYCVFVQAVNKKGGGPVLRECSFTAEDYPEGPPRSIAAKGASSTSLKVKLRVPGPDVVNGIIQSYRVFYAETDANGTAIGPQKSLLVHRKGDEEFTIGFIENLKKYTWYILSAYASTSVGPGPNITRDQPVRTLEDVPSAPPRKLSFNNVKNESFAVLFQQTEIQHMNGIFTKFHIRLVENRRDGTNRSHNCDAIENNGTFIGTVSPGAESDKNQSASNQTGVSGTPAPGGDSGSGSGRRKRRALGNFPTFPPLNPPTPGIPLVSTAASESSNQTGPGGNVSGSQIKIDSSWATASFVIPDTETNTTTQVMLSIKSEYFSVTFSGLLSYTNYDVYIAACTKVGCGSTVNGSVRTDQSAPGAAPILLPHATSYTNSLIVSWQQIPIMLQNGVITGYMVKCMKYCEFMRWINLNETADCVRVPAENTTTFVEKAISPADTSAELKGLAAYTRYHVAICAKTIKSFGPCLERIYQTDEGVPSQPPNVTSVYETTGKSFKIIWDNVHPYHQNGVIRGYQVRFQLTEYLNDTYDDAGLYQSQNTTAQPPPNEMELKELALKSNYTFKIAAYTSKGMGAFSDIKFAMTGDFKHGNWSEWSKWSFCSESCGGGTSTKYRRCDNPKPFNGGDDCKGPSNEKKPCNTHICSGLYMGRTGQNCIVACRGIGYYCNPNMVVRSTADYAKLGYQCQDSTAKAAYSLPYHPSYVQGRCEGYKDIPTMINCTVSPPNDGTHRLCDCMAPGDCGCEEWAQWSICSVPKCGGGTKARKRICESKPWCPPGNTSQLLECNTKPCPVDGNWGQWSEISACNRSCGYGYRHRYRKCDNPEAAHGGAPCPGTPVDVIPECNTHMCPVHGQWGQWQEWRTCNQPCGGGTSVRRRYCDSPAPRYLGKDCEGASYEAKPCNPNPCEGVEVLFTVKLTDFEWKFHYVYLHNPMTQELTTECQTNVKAIYNYSSIIKTVNVLNYKQGSVVANFSVFYVQVKQGEILLLQDYISTTGKLNNLSTVMQAVTPMQVVTDPPTNPQATSFSPHTMTLTWVPPPNVEQIVNVSGYYVFYREYDSPPGKWDVAGVPGLKTTSFLLPDLKAFTKYRFRMTLAVRSGNGPATDEIVNNTVEGIPSVAPTNLQIKAVQPTEIFVEWTKIPDSKWHGRQLGYRVKYKPYHDTTWIIKTVPKQYSDTSVTGMKAFTLYTMEVEAYTGKGPGLPVAGVIKTPEGVPSISPPSFAVTDEISTTTLQASWKEIPQHLVNGRLLGYKLKYTVTHVADQAVVGAPITKTIDLDKYTFIYKITGLQSYTRYEVSVAGYTAAGDGPYSSPIVSETCKCPNDVFLNWYSNPPYVTKNPGLSMTGIFAELIQSMIASSCGKCNNLPSTVRAFQSLSGENPIKKNEKAVKNSIGKEFHVSFPIFGYSTITRYMDAHVFILFIQSSGSATIVRNEVDYAAKTLNAFKSIGNIWPMYVIMVLLTGLAGIFIWITERTGNEEFSRGSYFDGALQGFWWAFISMTTVGYGDITPRTIQGRVVAIIWTLAGLVLSGILLGALTSSVTTMTLPPEVKLYGTESAAVNNSFEYNLGVRRNSKVNSKRQYETTDQVLQAVHKKEVDIALLDAFTAASLQSKIVGYSLKVKKMINANTGYGVVLSREFVRLESDFRSFIASNQDKISSFTSNMTEKLHVADSDAAKEVPMLFDPSTKLFWDMIKMECILLGACTALGLLYSLYLYSRKKKIAARIISADQMLLRKMAEFDESVEQFEQTVTEKLDAMTKRHDLEIKELLRLQKSYQRLMKRKYPDYEPNTLAGKNKKKVVVVKPIGQSET